MDINRKTRNKLRVQGFSFIILVAVIASLAFMLSREYNHTFDWTAYGRHSLTQASIKVLEKLDAPVKITSFANSSKKSPARDIVYQLVKRYQDRSDKIHLEFIDPYLEPGKKQEMKITVDGEMIVAYKGRNLHLKDASEQALTNTLEQLLRDTNRHILFVTGHGERQAFGEANHDLGQFADKLSAKGFKLAPLDLGKTITIPFNTSVLVIASPQVDYLPNEENIIIDYVKNGGNLLLLIDPEKRNLLQKLQSSLNMGVMNGTVMDYNMGKWGYSATFVQGNYYEHAITKNFQTVRTLYQSVAGIELKAKDNWKVEPLIQSIKHSWLETGASSGSVTQDETDVPGPITFAFAMTRELKSQNNSKSQRLIIIGDGDFLSNTYVGLLGNLAMGESMLNWLAHDDDFIDIPPAVAPDTKIQTNKLHTYFIGMFFILILPLGLIGSGVYIWLRRRKK